jgi:hypothetical protein
MTIPKLIVDVPPKFAERMRQDQLIRSSLFSIFFFGVAWAYDSRFQWLGLFMIARILIILAFSKTDLIYRFTQRGVSITTSRPISAALMPLGLRVHHGWPANSIVTVEHRYVADYSVVLLRSKITESVYYLPVAPSDVTLVADFLLSHSEDKTDDDEQTNDFIK